MMNGKLSGTELVKEPKCRDGRQEVPSPMGLNSINKSAAEQGNQKNQQ